MRRNLRGFKQSKQPTSRETVAARWQWPFRHIVVGTGLCALLVGGVLILRTSANPQSETPTTTEQTAIVTPDPPGTIDGAKNPELIPDDVAMRMIVLAVAEPTDATDDQKGRARAKIQPIGLSEDDATAFLNLLAEFEDQVEGVDRQVADIYQATPIPDPASTVYKQLVDLSKQKDQLANDVVAAIPARLSEDGLAKLSAFLPEAKKGIKIIPDAMSNTMSMD